MTDLAALEAAVMAAGPDDAPPVAPMLALPAPEGPPPGDFAQGDPDPEGPPQDDLISPEVWREQWAAMHDMAGGMVQMRTGNPCPLGDQARSAGGVMAADACYSLLLSTPFLARLVLGAQSSFIGQVAIVGMHGFACVQMVKASASAPRAEGSE